MFRFFENQIERRAYGGSAFIELQYCKMKSGTKLKKIVASSSVHYWQDDSLYIYVDDIDDFFANYNEIFQELDCYGINYYSPDQLKDITAKIEKQMPLDCAVILEWIKRGVDYNGIYILGI